MVIAKMYVVCLFFTADIVFIVKDKPHSIFKREGKDLLFTATLPLGKVCNV